MSFTRPLNHITLTKLLGIALIVVGSVIFSRWVHFEKEVSCFVNVGNSFIVENELSSQIIGLSPSGYDGQFYYRFALNPFSKNVNTQEIIRNKDNYRLRNIVHYDGIKMEGGNSYRRRRIAYPIAAWLLSGGQHSITPYSMVYTNILAFLLIIWCFFQLSKIWTFNVWYALAPLLLIGNYISLVRSTAELFTLSMLALCFLAFVQKKWIGFLIFASLALLSREDSIAFIWPGLLLMVTEKMSTNKSLGKNLTYLGLSLVPILVYLLWIVCINYIEFGNLKELMPFVEENNISENMSLEAVMPNKEASLSKSNAFKDYTKLIGIPFKGVFESWKYNYTSLTRNIIEKYSFLFYYTVVCLTAFWAIKIDWKDRISLHLGLSFFSLLVGYSFIQFYDAPWAITRITNPLFLSAFLLILYAKKCIPKPILFFGGIAFIVIIKKVIEQL